MRTEQKLSVIVFFIGVFVVGAFGYFQQGGFFSASRQAPAYKTVYFKSVDDINRFFQQHNFSVQGWKEGAQKIPWLVLTDIPEQWGTDIAPNLTVEQKKNLFLRFALPLIFVANEEIEAQREKLLNLMTQKSGLAADKNWIEEKAVQYRLTGEKGRSLLEELKQRMDSIPPSIAVAQMIEESGWGTSRFAADGNALFGQWSYEGGLKPLNQRSEKGDYRIKAFDTPLASVRAYMRNLNSNQAYEDFRIGRARQREKGEILSGLRLLHTLSKYSERGAAYTETLHLIISKNRLSSLDSARLEKQEKYLLTPTFSLVDGVFSIGFPTSH